MSQSSNLLRLVSWTWQWVHFTQMASTVTRSQSNRAPLGCGGTGDSHHGCAADKSAATAWCYHGYQLQLASSSRHWCLHIEQPQAQHPPTSTHYYEFTSPPEVWDLLLSNASWYHHREAQNHSPEHSLSPFLAGGMIFPPPSGMLDPCQSSSNNWKLISFNSTWLLEKKKNIFHFFKIFIFLFLFLSFPC